MLISAADHTTPLVSIVTATYNAAATVRSCLESVAAQDYPRIEHIVVDGASSDATMDIVRTYPNIRWISEPDKGIYDAWNKAFDLAQGDWIAFLGADDVYVPGAISAYMRLAAQRPQAQYLSGKVQWVGGKRKTRVIGKAWSWPRFQRYMCTAHVGSMHRRDLFLEHGKYNAGLRIVADYELLLRAGPDLRAAFLPQVTAVMQGGGVSDSIASVEETARVKVATGKRNGVLARIECIAARQMFRARRVMSRWI